MGLVKQKNGWHFESAVELNELNKPIAKLVSTYNRGAKELQSNETRINALEDRITQGMQKFRSFQRPDIRRWILDGMQEYPDAPRATRVRIDEARQEYERFRERYPVPASQLQKRLDQLQNYKQQYQDDIRTLGQTVDEISDIERLAQRLLRDIEKAAETLGRESANVQSALTRSGSDLTTPDISNTENLLKKTNSILEGELVDALRDRRDNRF